MWKAITYVGSALTLLAFIAAVAAWLYRSKLLERQRLIREVPEKDRAELVERTLVLFKIDADKLKGDQQYELALQQIQEHAKGYRTTAIVVVVIACLAAALTAVALLKKDSFRPEPPPPTPMPTPMRLSGKIERVEVAPYPSGGSQLLVLLSIENNGPPTSVQQYSLWVAHTSLKSIDFKGWSTGIKERLTVITDGKTERLVVEPQDALAVKTEMAVKTGDRVSGWLLFIQPLPTLTPNHLRQSGIRYTVKFADARGNAYEASKEVP